MIIHGNFRPRTRLEKQMFLENVAALVIVVVLYGVMISCLATASRAILHPSHLADRLTPHVVMRLQVPEDSFALPNLGPLDIPGAYASSSQEASAP